jgi:hypothetical protein
MSDQTATTTIGTNDEQQVATQPVDASDAEMHVDANNNKRTHSQMAEDTPPQQQTSDDSVALPDEKRIRLDTNAQPATANNETASASAPAQKTSTRAALLDKLKRQKTKLDTLVANEPPVETTPSPAPTPVITTPGTNGTTGPKKRGRKPKSAKPPSPVPSDDEETKGRRQRRPSNRFSEAAAKISDTSFQQCYKLLLTMKNHRWAWPFNTPVEPEKLGIPDYFNIIKKPMDLGSVERKLLDNEYESIQEFHDDVQLVWTNCLTYNQPGSDVVRMAEELKRLFTEKWQKLVSDLEAGLIPAEASSPTRKTPVKHEVVSEEKKTPRPSAPRSTRKKTPSDARPMTFDEKKKLSSDITKLTVDMLQQVVEIIQNRAPKASSQANELEIEIDLDKLDPVTLRTLERYVKSALSSKKKKKGGSKSKSKATTEGTSSATSTPATSTTTGEDTFAFTESKDVSAPKSPKKIKNEDSESSGGSSDESSGTESSSDSGKSFGSRWDID